MDPLQDVMSTKTEDSEVCAPRLRRYPISGTRGPLQRAVHLDGGLSLESREGICIDYGQRGRK